MRAGKGYRAVGQGGRRGRGQREGREGREGRRGSGHVGTAGSAGRAAGVWACIGTLKNHFTTPQNTRFRCIKGSSACPDPRRPSRPSRCPRPRPAALSCPSRLELGAWGSGLGAWGLGLRSLKVCSPLTLTLPASLHPLNPQGKKPQTNPKKLKKTDRLTQHSKPQLQSGVGGTGGSRQREVPKDRALADLLARVVPGIALLACGLLRSRIGPDASAADPRVPPVNGFFVVVFCVATEAPRGRA